MQKSELPSPSAIPRLDWPVYRTRPLPIGPLRGTFLMAEPLLAATRDALVSFALAGIHDGGHEGMVFWAGRETAGCTLFLQTIVPDAEASAQGVMASREAIGQCQRTARERRLGILCQVHSHPGNDARHSDGDDSLILLPFENMLSIVVPNFGIGFSSLSQACVHQFQEGRWTLCTPESVAENLIVIPTLCDLR